MEATQTSRLVLHKLVLENFKSYAGTVEIGPFDNSFSCIVGPNGSGKSNVIDAIQFVFGKSGTKLRLKKLSELIHNSANFPHCDFARVTVYMHEINTQEEILHEYTVARAVNKQSNTKYFLNGEKSSYSEITEFLLDKGIDLNFNRFLILQGEVEQIAQMKPKSPNTSGDVSQRETGLLEYIEDVIGTTKYVEPIEKQAVEVETLTEQRQEKLNRVKAVEDEVGYLEDSKNEAEEFLKSRVRLYSLQKELTSQQAEGAKIDLSTTETKLQEHKQKDEQINNDIKLIENTNKGLFEEFKQMKQKLDKLDLQKKETKEALEQFEIEDEKLTSELRLLNDTVNQKSKQLSDNKSKIKGLTEDIEALKSEVEESQRELAEEINVELEKHEKKREQLQKEATKEIEPFRVEIESIKKNKLAAETKRLQELNAKLQIEKEQLQIFTDKFNRVEKDLEEFKKQLTAVTEEIPQASTKVKQHQTINQQLSKRIPLLQKELQEQIEPSILTHETEIRKLRQKVQVVRESQNTTKTQSRLLTALMEQKSKGSIPNIYDRLGNLALVDAKYDVAISTAAKAALDMIVVKDSASGKACVEFLHKQQLGVASFILMDVVKREKKKMLDRMQQKSDSFPAPRLFDLIEFEELSEDEKNDKERAEYLEDIKLAFYYGMRDTLVCESLDKATQIAYSSTHKEKMYRIVTLNGELIESSGTMSGGGKQQFKGACNLTKRGRGSSTSLANEFKEIKQDEEKIEKLEKELVNLKERKSNVQQQLDECTEQQKKIESELNKLLMDEKALQKKQNQLSQKIKELEVQNENQKSKLDKDSKFKSEVAQMEQSISNIEGQIEEQNSKTEALQKHIQELQGKIDNAGGGAIKKISVQISELQQKQKELEQAITKKQVQFESSTKKLKRMSQTIETLQIEIAQTQDKIELRQKEHKELESKAENVLVNCAKADEEFKNFKREYEEKETMYSKEKEKIEDFKKALSDISAKISESEKAVTELSKRVKYFNDKVTNLDKQIQSIVSEYSLENIDEESLSSLEIDELKHEILVLEEKLKKTNNSVNLVAIIQYRKKHAEFETKKAELDAVTNERNNAQKQLEELRKKRLDEFMTGFTNITMKLKEIYQMITLGGDAELELVDSLDPFSEGIVFSVRPPKKSWKNIAHLSGGEKTLSSLALVFALHTFKPTPIYMMDEIDAALDFKNVSIVANYIKEKTKNCAQFIVISLRNNMFELADMLVGIYKTNFTTKSVAVNPHLVSVKPSATSSNPTKNVSVIPSAQQAAQGRVPLATLPTNL